MEQENFFEKFYSKGNLYNLIFNKPYRISNIRNMPASSFKRIAITVVLKESMQIDQIKTIAIEVMKPYQISQNVILIYIARNDDDLVLSNWILRGQWIDPNLDEKQRPHPLEHYEEGYYWSYNQSVNAMSDFNNKHIFEDDRTLFVNFQNIWKEFLSIYKIIYDSFQKDGWEDFASEFHKQQLKLTKIFMKISNFAHSRNKDFDDFLNSITSCISPVEDLQYKMDNENFSDDAKSYLFSNAFQKAETEINNINQGLSEWRKALQIIE